jgi:hypothetical protein
MGNALRVAGAATVAAVAIVATGCGSATSPSASSATTTTTNTTAPGGATTADRTAFNACLAQHGVTLPSRPAGGGGNGQPPAGGGGGGGGGGLANLTAAQRAAFTACRSKLPAGGGFGGGRAGGGNRANNPAFAKYNDCLKQHGVTLGKSNDQTTFAKAQAACAKLAPTGGPATPAAPGGGTSIQ